jgi:hypothetical protein
MIDPRSSLNRIRSAWRRHIVGAILSAFVLAGRAQKTLLSMRPSQLILPSFFAQIVFLLFSLGQPIKQIITCYAVGDILIVGFALLPTIIQKPKYHWVGNNYGW